MISVSFLKKSALFILVLGAFTSATSVFALTQNEARLLLDKMSDALRQQNYQGRFIYRVDAGVRSFEIQHALIDEKEYERLVFLNEKNKEVVRSGHDLFCVHTGNHLVRDRQELNANPFNRKSEAIGKGVFESYALEATEGEMIAGRDAIKLSFLANDGVRYDHSLWIDTESHLLLKSEIHDEQEGSLESFEYIQLEHDVDIPKSKFNHENYVRHKAKHQHSVAKPSDGALALNDTLWRLSWLPNGFFFSGVSHEVVNNDKTADNKQITMLMFTDGLAAITLFIEPVDKLTGLDESSRRGAMSAYSFGKQFSDKDFMITVFGDVPLLTLERIAKALEYRESKS